MNNHVILGVHITDRVKKATDVQKVFTQYGCNIKTRIGLHEVDEKFCSPNGLIVLEMVGDDATIQEMHEQLSAIAGVQVQQMVFTHP